MVQKEVIGSHFDYVRQAWTYNGRYVRCEHPACVDCDCYGRQHEGERAPIENLPTAVEETLYKRVTRIMARYDC